MPSDSECLIKYAFLFPSRSNIMPTRKNIMSENKQNNASLKLVDSSRTAVKA